MSAQERQALVDRLLKGRKATGQGAEIQPQPRTSDTFPLSYSQQRYWVLNRIFPNTTGFNVVRVFHLRGPVDRGALEASLRDLTARHEVFRTVFEGGGGAPVQRILPAFDLVPSFLDLRTLPEADRVAEVKRLAYAEGQRLWDLGRVPPVRANLWQIADHEHAFVLSMHHIISDGWSMNTVVKELFALYNARREGRPSPLSPLPLQYADYAVWHRQWVETEGFETQLSYWRRRLTGAPTLRLPSRVSELQTAAGLTRRVMLPAALVQRLKARTQAEGVTSFMALLSIFAMLLSTYAEQESVVVGSPVASRTRPELEGVVGCFMNPLPFRVDLHGTPTFRDVLARVRDAALEVYANQDVPFDAIVKAVASQPQGGLPPLYQAMLLLHNFPSDARRALQSGAAVEGLQATPWPLMTANLETDNETPLVTDRLFPVALEMVEAKDVIAGAVEYAPEYAEVFARFPAQFVALLDAVVSEPDRPVRELVPRPARAAAPARAATWRSPSTGLADDISVQFESQAARTPDNVAVVDGAAQLTYRQLADRVSQLAGFLQAATPDAERPVAILLERSADAIAALLAALRAGRPYLPLDLKLPPDRLAYMLDHARVPLVVTRADVLHEYEIDPKALEGRSVIRLDLEAGAIDSHAPSPLALARPEQLAYVLYTSGSTGRPKGVAIPRRALSNYVRVAREAFALGPRDRLLQFSSLSFDTSAEEIYPTLTSGAALVLRNEAMLGSVPAFFSACAEWGITVLDLPTAYWHELAAHVTRSGLRVPEHIRLVCFGGEKALAERVREWRAGAPHVVMLNSYGPTEATIVTVLGNLSQLEEIGDEVPLGQVIPDAQAYVLDANLARVSAGELGELYIGGEGLARGYLYDPALTAERFIPDPYTGVPGARLYRTGDLARITADGTIEFGGRADDQVKLRGFRIELGEIESVLAQHPGVRDAAVMLREDHPGDRRLAAYVVPFDPSAPLIADLRRFLQERLPEYMVPSAFVALDALPRSVQGKVVRAALPAPGDGPQGGGERYIAPQTDVERKIAALWGEVLHRDRVGVLDNFFDIGGHSLLVIQLHAKLCEAFGADLTLVDLFRFPTVQSQAAHLAQHKPQAQATQASMANAVLDRAARQRQAFRRRPGGVADTVAG